MFIDFILNRIPIRLLHFYHLSIFGAVYTIFSLVLHWTGFNSAIYPVLDWANRTGFAIGLCLIIIFVVCPIVHFILYGIYKLKILIYNKLTDDPITPALTSTNLPSQPPAEVHNPVYEPDS